MIPGQTLINQRIKELDEKSSVEVLRKCFRNKVDNARLTELAKLCGFVPLALCISGTLIRDLYDPADLVQWLNQKQVDAEKRSSDQCV